MGVTTSSKVRESFIKTRIKAFIPFWLQKKIYSGIKALRFLKNKANRTYTKEDLKRFLSSAGISKGDTIMLHSSLGRIGYVEGGADALIDAFIEVIGKEGTLVMPTFSSPEYDAKNKCHIFDIKNTPAYTGTIPETFRNRKGVLRSTSPLHSVAAYGLNARYIIRRHEQCDNPYAMDGPFGRLYNLNAKICQIGVDQLANSSIHLVEDKCKFPVRVFTRKLKAIVTENGKKRTIHFRKHLPHLYKIRKNNIIEDYLVKEGLLSIHPFGRTELRIHRIKDLVATMERLLDQGITIYNQ